MQSFGLHDDHDMYDVALGFVFLDLVDDDKNEIVLCWTYEH